MHRTRFEKQFVQDVDVVSFAHGNPYHGRDRAVKIEQGMQLDRPLPFCE